MKAEEINRVEDINQLNFDLNTQLKQLEESIRKINNEQNLLNVSSNVRSENLNKEINTYKDINKNLETELKEIKQTQENTKFNYEFQINKLNSELKSVDEKLSLAMLSSETLKRDFDNKNKHIENLKNSENTITIPIIPESPSKSPINSKSTLKKIPTLSSQVVSSTTLNINYTESQAKNLPIIHGNIKTNEKNKTKTIQSEKKSKTKSSKAANKPNI